MSHHATWELTASHDRMISRIHGDYMLIKEKVAVNPSKYVHIPFYAPAKATDTNMSKELGQFPNRDAAHAAAVEHDLVAANDVTFDERDAR